MFSSVLPVLRNLPSDHPRAPPLPGFKRSPLSVWPFILLLALVVFVAITLAQTLDDDAATPPRSTARGRVTQIERIGADVPANAQQTFVKYRFMAGDDLIYGNEIAQSNSVIPAIGDRIEVSYAPDAPQDNYRAIGESAGEEIGSLPRLWFIALSTIFVILWFIFMLFMFSPVTPRDWLTWRRARGLYRNGEVTAGCVQFVRPAGLRSPSGIDKYEIVATYKVEGVRLLATTRCNNAWLANQLAPETEVVVAYDPLKPERAVILEPFAF